MKVCMYCVLYFKIYYHVEDNDDHNDDYNNAGGRVTAGSASGICDGAASLIVSGETGVSENNLSPLTRIISWSRVGVG